MGCERACRKRGVERRNGNGGRGIGIGMAGQRDDGGESVWNAKKKKEKETGWITTRNMRQVSGRSGRRIGLRREDRLRGDSSSPKDSTKELLLLRDDGDGGG